MTASTGDQGTTAQLEAALTAAVRDMVLRSPRSTELAGGAAAVRQMLEAIRGSVAHPLRLPP